MNWHPGMPHRHPANIARHDKQSDLYVRVDGLLAYFGSVKFLGWQTLVIAAWCALNVMAISWRWDPYPFILLNLVFSTQAAYAAPLILLSQNRQAEHDRHRAEEDYQTNADDSAVNIETRELVRQVHTVVVGAGQEAPPAGSGAG